MPRIAFKRNSIYCSCGCRGVAAFTSEVQSPVIHTNWSALYIVSRPGIGRGGGGQSLAGGMRADFV